jgi:hypothetical protein
MAPTGSLQYQISEMMARREFLAPAEEKKLANLKEMRWMLKKADIDGAKEALADVAKAPRRKVRPVAKQQEVRRSGRLERSAPEEQVDESGTPNLEEAPIAEVEDVPDAVVKDVPDAVVEDVPDAVAGGEEEQMGEQVVAGGDKKTCGVCGKLWRCAGNLAAHMLSMHVVGEVQFACTKDFCHSTFLTLWEMTTHRVECRWRCEGCGWSTQRCNRVAGHIRKCRDE